jgi:hypothetical protein
VDSCHVVELDNGFRTLRNVFSEPGTSNDLDELLLVVIRRPGFTSPAEPRFANVPIDAVQGSASHTRQLHDAVIEGARARPTPERAAGAAA